MSLWAKMRVIPESGFLLEAVGENLFPLIFQPLKAAHIPSWLRAPALHLKKKIFYFLFFWLCYTVFRVLSSLTRDWTQTPAVIVLSPNHWISRESLPFLHLWCHQGRIITSSCFYPLALSAFSFFTYKNSSNYSGPRWITQDNLPISSSTDYQI